jgi:putative ABC transport system substrate-binding protein
MLSPYPESDKSIQAQLALFRSALGQFGWSEGHNLRIDYRWAGGDMDRLAPLARELVELRPNALLVRATPGAVAAMRATRTIPIVFVVVSDPVGDGLVTSIAHPGGNVTGFTKWLGGVDRRKVDRDSARDRTKRDALRRYVQSTDGSGRRRLLHALD